MRTAHATIGALMLLLLAAPPASATVMVPLDVPALTRGAAVVVQGRVTSLETVLRGGDPWTVARVTVSQVFKGAIERGAQVNVEQPGGEVGNAGLYIPGSASFRAGEEVVVFLFRDAGTFYPYGMAQGVFHVYKDPRGRRRAARDLVGTAFATFDAAGLMRLAPAPKAIGDTDLPVTELASRIRRAVRGGVRR